MESIFNYLMNIMESVGKMVTGLVVPMVQTVIGWATGGVYVDQDGVDVRDTLNKYKTDYYPVFWIVGFTVMVMLLLCYLFGKGFRTLFSKKKKRKSSRRKSSYKTSRKRNKRSYKRR